MLREKNSTEFWHASESWKENWLAIPTTNDSRKFSYASSDRWKDLLVGSMRKT